MEGQTAATGWAVLYAFLGPNPCDGLKSGSNQRLSRFRQFARLDDFRTAHDSDLSGAAKLGWFIRS